MGEVQGGGGTRVGSTGMWMYRVVRYRVWEVQVGEVQGGEVLGGEVQGGGSGKVHHL